MLNDIFKDPRLLAMLAKAGQGMAEPEGTFSPVAPPPVTPNSQALAQQAFQIPDAARRNPALRTADLIGLLGALAMPQKQRGQFVGGYLGAKQNVAADDTQRAQADVDRRRQALVQMSQFAGQQERQAIEQAQFDRKLKYDADQAEKDRVARQKGIETTVQGRTDVAGIKADTDLKKAEYTYKGKVLDSDAKKYGMGLVSQDANLKAGLGVLMKLPEKARPGFAKVLADKFPVLADWDEDAIQALGTATASEAAKREQVNTFHQQAGYYGARARNVTAMTAPAKALLVARAKKADADAHKAIAAADLDEAQAASLRERTKFYEPEFRLKQATFAAKLAKAQSGDVDELRGEKLAKDAYKGMAGVAKEQIARILKANGGKPPEPLINGEDNPDYTTYMLAVKDQTDAREGLRRIGKRAATVNPVTSARPSGVTGSVRPITPTLPNPISGPIGGQRRLSSGRRVVIP